MNVLLVSLLALPNQRPSHNATPALVPYNAYPTTGSFSEHEEKCITLLIQASLVGNPSDPRLPRKYHHSQTGQRLG